MRFWGSGIPTKRGNFHETFRYVFVAPFFVKLPGKRRFLRINNYMVLWTMNHPIVNILYSCLQRIINSYLDKLDRNSRKSFLVPKSVSVTFKTFWGRRVHNGSSEKLTQNPFRNSIHKGLGLSYVLLLPLAESIWGNKNQPLGETTEKNIDHIESKELRLRHPKLHLLLAHLHCLVIAWKNISIIMWYLLFCLITWLTHYG